MTPAKLDELQRLADAATPGPWQRHDTVTQLGVAAGSPPETRAYLTGADDAKRICYSNKINGENMDFIAALDPDTVRELIALARRGMELEAMMQDSAYEQRTRG